MAKFVTREFALYSDTTATENIGEMLTSAEALAQNTAALLNEYGQPDRIQLVARNENDNPAMYAPIVLFTRPEGTDVYSAHVTLPEAKDRPDFNGVTYDYDPIGQEVHLTGNDMFTVGRQLPDHAVVLSEMAEEVMSVSSHEVIARTAASLGAIVAGEVPFRTDGYQWVYAPQEPIE
jgi:hypothetical protein